MEVTFTVSDGTITFSYHADGTFINVHGDGTLTPTNNVYIHEDGCSLPDIPAHVDYGHYLVNVDLDTLTVPQYADAAYVRVSHYEEHSKHDDTGTDEDWSDWTDHTDNCYRGSKYRAHKDRFPDFDLSGTYTLLFNIPSTVAERIISVRLSSEYTSENEFELRSDPSGETVSSCSIEISRDKMPIWIKLISNMTNPNDDYY